MFLVYYIRQNGLLSLITEQSTVPCFPTIYLFLGDHCGVDKKKSGDNFGVGIISGSIWGSFQGWGSFRGRDHFGGCTGAIFPPGLRPRGISRAAKRRVKSTLYQSSHGFATRVHGFATKTKALAREIPQATQAS